MLPSDWSITLDLLLDLLLVALLEKMWETDKLETLRERQREPSMENPKEQKRVKWLGFL